MSDLVKRLREKSSDQYLHNLLDEAADRIEALEAALREIGENDCCEYCAKLARDVFAGEKKTEQEWD